MEIQPHETQCHVRIAGDLLTLLTLVVGEKYEARFVEAFEEHDSCRWLVIADCGQSHCVGLGDAACDRKVEPATEFHKWTGVKILLCQGSA